MSYPLYNQPVMSQLYPNLNYQPSVQNNGQQPLTNGNGELIRVHGLTGAYQCSLPPGTRQIIIGDDTEDIVYLIETDGINRNITPFKIEKIETTAQNAGTETKDTTALTEALTAINEKLSTMEGEINELKSDFASSKLASKFNSKSGNGSNAGSH